MTSTRLPGKVLKPIMGRPSLELMLERVARTPGLDAVVVATTTNGTDEPIVALAGRLGYPVFRGSEEDVVGRIAGAARAFEAQVLVELTSDCIAIDPASVAQCVDAHLASDVDYTANFLTRTYPVGMDTQVFSRAALEESDRLGSAADEREHVGLYVYRRPDRFRLLNVTAPPGSVEPDLHLTLDTADDYRMFCALFEGLYPSNPAFDTADLLAFLADHPEVARLNSQVVRKKSGSEYFAEIRPKQG